MPEDRVLYLDSDLIVDDAIDDLFTIPFNGKEILGVGDQTIKEMQQLTA